MEENKQPPCPIAGEPAEVEASQNARLGQPMTFMVRGLTTLEAIEQAQSRMDRLYLNATGIVDSCARGVMETCATDVMTSLRAAHDAQTRDLMALRAMVRMTDNGEEILSHIDAMLGIIDDEAWRKANPLTPVDELIEASDKIDAEA